jgi:Carboxypeptidase regulatory-like domain
MNPNAAKFLFGVALLFVLTAHSLRAQDSTAAISGTIMDQTGRALPDVKVSVKNLSTDQSIEVQTGSSGQYSFLNLPAGDYEVSASADGFAALTVKATVTGEGQKALNLTMLPSASGPQIDISQELPNAPSSTKTEPSLEDLGFSKSDIQSNAAQQALLDKRTHMLKIHQRMGLITTIPLVATVILGPGAGGKSEGTTTRNLHVALGALTGDLYGITAWYAIRAPRIKGTETRGPIRFHKAMAWIHGPGMILTPILGAIAFDQKNNGEKVHGIAQAHGAVAIVTAGAFGAALLSVSMKF